MKTFRFERFTWHNTILSSIFERRQRLLGRNPAIILVVIIYVFAILQDYLFSYLKGTGFYLLECSLYNTIWLLFLPLAYLINKFSSKYHVFYAIIYSSFHLLLFTLLFCIFSFLLFSPGHRFTTILKGAFANYFLLFTVAYFILSMIYTRKKEKQPPRLDSIELTKNNVKHRIALSQIIYIKTERPYLSVYTVDGRYLLDSTLRKIEKQTSNQHFTRIHRSFIINDKYLEEFTSRGNGDYDVKIAGGAELRASRHYRDCWEHLLR